MNRRRPPAFSAMVYQVILVVITGLLAYAVFHTTQTNLERLGVHSGFDFFLQRAGFDISPKLIAYGPDSSILSALLVAFLNTLLLAVVSVMLATVLGFAIGVFRLSGNWLLSQTAKAYVEIFRNVPVLLQIFFWYFVVLRALPETRSAYDFLGFAFLSNRGLFLPAPSASNEFWLVALSLIVVFLALVFLTRGIARGSDRSGRHIRSGAVLLVLLSAGWLAGSSVSWEVPRPGRYNYVGGMALTPEFVALAVGLAMYNASYIAEIVRSAFQSVPRGVIEAADSLGLGRSTTLRLIRLPLALRVMLPPLTTVYLNIVKSTSLAAAIAYPDVMSVLVGTVNNLIGQPLEIMAVTLLCYAVLSILVSLLMNAHNRKYLSRWRQR